MALSDKDILITPNKGQSADPKIEFKGADASLGPQTITLNVYPTNNGTLSLEGSAGQLFSVTNSLTGTIWSVNDVSGIPSLEVLDTGLVKIAQYSGNVLIGNGTDNGAKLEINSNLGTFSATGNSLVRLNNPNSLGQSPLDWIINGTLRGRFRTDYIGNVNYVANGGGHYFFTGGDSGVGTTRTLIHASGGVSIGNSTDPGATNLSVTGTVTAASFSGNASTATTLQTARTINGTSFNGSAAITTSSWGTARTITIGGTGKSVDGSAAVTWTVAEVIPTTTDIQLDSIGVGTAATGTTGEIRATNNITAYFSDDRLKTKLGNIENALDKICSLNGFYYEANETAQALGYKRMKEVGVSAQQVQAVLPEVVVPAPIDDKYLTVRYDKMIPLLIEAIKELREQINDLKAQ